MKTMPQIRIILVLALGTAGVFQNRVSFAQSISLSEVENSDNSDPTGKILLTAAGVTLVTCLYAIRTNSNICTPWLKKKVNQRAVKRRMTQLTADLGREEASSKAAKSINRLGKILTAEKTELQASLSSKVKTNLSKKIPKEASTENLTINSSKKTSKTNPPQYNQNRTGSFGKTNSIPEKKSATIPRVRIGVEHKLGKNITAVQMGNNAAIYQNLGGNAKRDLKTGEILWEVGNNAYWGKNGVVHIY